MSAIQHFLLVFDHEQERLIDEQHFGTDSRAALAAYSACERLNRDRKYIDILLVGSDSIETVHATHSNYFDGSVALSKYLVGL